MSDLAKQSLSGNTSAKQSLTGKVNIAKVLNVETGEVVDISNGVPMTDRSTGKNYIIYIEDGKLTMTESEE